jgi:RNA polymerase sigma-70 factor (sigma-E family)
LVAYDALPVTRDLAAAVAAEQEATRPVELVSAFQAHFAGLCRLAHLIVGDSALAEDIVQEAFLRTFAGWRRVRDPDRVHVYLRRAVINVSRSKLRRRGHERRANALVYGNTRAEGRPEADRESADVVVEAVRLLPERQKAAVLLRYYLDLRESDIADTLGTKVGTVKSQLAKARRNLEKSLAEAGDD